MAAYSQTIYCRYQLRMLFCSAKEYREPMSSAKKSSVRFSALCGALHKTEKPIVMVFKEHKFAVCRTRLTGPMIYYLRYNQNPRCR